MPISRPNPIVTKFTVREGERRPSGRLRHGLVGEEVHITTAADL
jgi:hypothetical protein